MITTKRADAVRAGDHVVCADGALLEVTSATVAGGSVYLLLDSFGPSGKSEWCGAKHRKIRVLETKKEETP